MTFLSSVDELERLSSETIPERFGGKAAGFTTLPNVWRPSAMFLSDDLYSRWQVLQSLKDGDKKTLTEELTQARALLGEDVMLRSSATNETVAERGQFRSDRASLSDIPCTVATIENLYRDYSPDQGGRMCLIIQRFIPALATGFLSNELRLVDKPYRWVVEQEVKGPSGTLFQSDTLSAKQANPYPATEPLMCVTRSELRSRLSSVARHFWQLTSRRDLVEWCWDGKRLWVLQRDDATPPLGGRLPSEIKQTPSALPLYRDGETFSIFQVGTSTPWRKLKNVLDFSEGSTLPAHRLYFSVAVSVRRRLRDDADGLAAEIDLLTGGRAVIRTDTVSSGFNLDRSDTLTGSQAVAWLHSKLEEWAENGEPDTNLVFIMHAYIPARAAAWSYFRRGDSSVFVDGLWGLADGMQYYPCDTHIADMSGRELSVTTRFKEFVLLEQPDGSWQTDRIDARFARYRALTKGEVSYIAIRTAEIANRTDHDVQIMWFVDVPKSLGLGHTLPWFKVTPEQTLDERPPAPLRAIRITGVNDLTKLSDTAPGSVKLILEPVGEDLRSNSFINEIAAACVRLHLPVELRGSILGHAYHQLRSKGVEVYSAEPRKRLQTLRQRKVFQKLVRDQVPASIKFGGETVSSGELAPAEVKFALAGKLIEEVEELVDAESIESAQEELADILEVVRGLAHSFKIPMQAVVEIADRKRDQKGGFERGTILRSTGYALDQERSDDLFDRIESTSGKLSLSDLTEAVKGNSVVGVPIARLLGSSRGQVFKLETLDLGPLIVSMTVQGGTISISVESDQRNDPQSNLF